MSFEPHVGFSWMLAVCLSRGLYQVLLKRRGHVPAPGDGLFVLLGLDTVILLPGIIGQAVESGHLLGYAWLVWGSMASISIGMGALRGPAPNPSAGRNPRLSPGNGVAAKSLAIVGKSEES